MEVEAVNVSTVSVRSLDGCPLKHAMEVGGGRGLGSRVQVDVSQSRTIHRLPSSANGCFSGGRHFHSPRPLDRAFLSQRAVRLGAGCWPRAPSNE